MYARTNMAHIQKRKRTFLFKLCFPVAGLIILLLLADSLIRPIVQDIASHHAKLFAMKYINDAMMEELGRENISYGDMVTLTWKDTGEVGAIQSNMMTINYLKTHLTERIISELERKGGDSFKIPAGTLLGNQFTSGRGPLVEIKAIPVGFVQTSIKSQFVSAGINQTLHQIMLEAKIEIAVVIPGYTIKTEVLTSYCLAETVIVGSIPGSYAEINLGESPLIARIGDYGF